MHVDSAALCGIVAAARRPVGLKELMRLAGLHPGQATALKRVLRDMVRKGELLQDGKRWSLPKPRGPEQTTDTREVHRARPGQRPARAEAPRVEAPPRRGALVGTATVRPEGFAFVRLSSGEGDDVFLPPHEGRKLLDGDRVELALEPGRDGRPVGRVVRVLDRTRQLAVGEYHEDRGGAWVDCEGLGRVQVPKTQLARPGDAVKVRLGVGARVLGPGVPLVGEVAGALGRPGDRSVEVLTLAYARGFHDEFPPEVMDQADAFALTVSPEEAHEKGRKDLRALGLVTIDGEDARDFDDAIYAEDVPEGWRLWVAVADVSHYVREGTPLDQEARRRATSVYLPGRVLPMLPERLSNGICSLRPDEDRLCQVAELVIDRQGRTRTSALYPAVMRSAARCTYTEVHEVLAGRDVPHRAHLAPLFRRLLALSRALKDMRARRGAIDFDLDETKVELAEDGRPLRMVRRERWESHRVVEECMLAANEAVARWFREQGLPTVHRHHGDPDEAKLEIFRGLADAHGLEVPKGALESKQLNDLLRQLEGHPEQRALNKLLLRSMMQAVYSSQKSGHYGLGAPDYLHFTSPIRRYPDLVVHRLLQDHWRRGRPPAHLLERHEEKLEESAQLSSERERAAMAVERDVVGFYGALMLEDRVGEVLPGVVSGLSDKAVWIELEDLFIDGQAPCDSLAADWEFVPERHRLVLGGGREVRVGQKVQVKLALVDARRRLVLLQVLELDGKALKSRVPHAPVAAAPDARRGGRPERGGHERRGQQRGSHDRAAKGRGGSRQGPPGRPAKRAKPGRRFGRRR